MDIRIGLADAPRELTIELDDDASVEEIKASIEAGLAGGGLIWMTDKKGRQIGFRSDKVTFVDVSAATSPRMGFG